MVSIIGVAMKKNYSLILLITSLLVGVLLTWQFTSEKSYSSNFIADEMNARDTLLTEYLDEQAYLQSKILLYREEIEKTQASVEDQSQSSNLKLLEELKEDVGLTEVRGSGVEIMLDDSPFAKRDDNEVTDIELIQAADLRDVVNVLYASNVDAISINDQRIIATSTITSVGSTLLVNNSHIAPPFVIKAVGDSEIIIQRLLNEPSLSSLYERSAVNSLIVEIAIKEWLTVPRYNGNLNVNYLNLVSVD